MPTTDPIPPETPTDEPAPVLGPPQPDPEPAEPDQPATVFVRTKDAAEIRGITERTVRKHIAAGKLPAQRVNGAYMVELPREEVEAAGIVLEPMNPDEAAPDERRTLVVQRPEERRPVDLAPLTQLVERLSVETRDLAADRARWQERARWLEDRVRQLEGEALALGAGPGTDGPERPWWKFW